MKNLLPKQIKYIEKCKLVHKDKFDYSLTEYMSSRQKVKIICKEHGVFEQRANDHLRGCGCLACAGRSLKFTQETFITACQKKHGDGYSYEPTIYTSMKKKIIVRCKLHGDFSINAYKHKTGSGCTQCLEIKKHANRIAKAIGIFKKVHGDAYTYENMIYKYSHEPIEVTCKVHGGFWVVGNQHKLGSGCPYCIGGRRLTREEVINRFRAKHGLTYDYSEVIYFKSIIPVVIICRTHGKFKQCPDSHWDGSGCPTCALEKTSKRLITRSKQAIVPLSALLVEFKAVHGETYDYTHINLDNYNNQDCKIAIKCSKHGVFMQSPRSHKNGRGCPECLYEPKQTTEEIIKDFRLVHGETYDYSNVVFKAYQRKVEIKCEKHGVFVQTPKSHLKGVGCKQCSMTILQEQEIKAYIEKHGNKYGYDRVVYLRNDKMVEIYCKNHQEYFFQIANNHKKGSGCPKCKKENLSKTVFEVFALCIKTHGTAYDYSDSKYAGMNKKMSMRCHHHGVFDQKTADHIRGHGCPQCGFLKIKEFANKKVQENPQSLFKKKVML